MKKLLIISNDQFGYLIDTTYYVKYLKDKFKISILCFDNGLSKIDNGDIETLYIPNSNFIKKRILLFKFLMKSIKNTDIVLVHYFPLCFIVSLVLDVQLCIMDIRTGKISANSFIRISSNLLIKFESLFFSKTSVISSSLRKNLFISKTKSFILPLGAEELSNTTKDFSKLKLFYIGKLTEIREIHKTIVGLYRFLSNDLNNRKNIEYHIVGSGNEESNLKELVLKLNLSDCVYFYGYKTHIEIKHLWDYCNIGISFVPKKAGFDLQPPTKTYEYLKSGMFVIATSTYENSKIINQDNGVLINDTEIDFEKALYSILKRKNSIDSKLIRDSVLNNSWSNIIDKLIGELKI